MKQKAFLALYLTVFLLFFQQITFAQSLNKPIKTNPPLFKTSLVPGIKSSPTVPLNIKDAACKDSSYYKQLSKENRTDIVYSSTLLNDGGILIVGCSRDLAEGYPYLFFGWAMKLDNQGNFVWAKEIRGNIHNTMYFQTIRELKDGSIILSGIYFNALYDSPGSDYNDGMLVKLSSKGDLVWFRSFHSGLSTCNAGGQLYFNDVKEGQNGELLLTGWLQACTIRYLTAVKTSADGALIWAQAFQYASPVAEGIGIFYKDHEVVLIGKGGSVAADGFANIHFMRLDYSTGNLLSAKAWIEPSAYPQSLHRSFYTNVHSVLLENGRYCVYGQLVGDINIMENQIQHFGVVEFDDQFNFKKGYKVQSPLKSNYHVDNIKVGPTGKAAFSLVPNATFDDLYVGTIDDGNITSQRKISIKGLGLFSPASHVVLPDGSSVLLRSIGNSYSPIYTDYYRMYDSDTSSSGCLGEKVSLISIQPMHFSEVPLKWKNITDAKLGYTNHNGIESRSIDFVSKEMCGQQSFCDQLMIKGDSVSCDISREFVFTASKNEACGAWVKWTIDPQAVALFEQLNDSTLKLRFHQGWSGYLKAEIATSCGILKDSIKLTIASAPETLDLGIDTSLCPSNSLLLNAKKGFLSYLWQDGSTDSTFNVASPGTYHVEVTDACRGVLRDTITISAAAPIPFNIGADRNKCNGDTVHFTAPDGFSNYRWAIANGGLMGNTATAIVNPAITTTYFVQAEKLPGCFAYDTVQVVIHHPTSINLGKDTTLCAGDSLFLDAGDAFLRYQWDAQVGGQNSSSIIARNKGAYSVQAWDNNGCLSKDTLSIREVFSLPSISLNKNTILCYSDTRTLNAGNGFSDYQWSTGATTPSISINGLGIYKVQVKDRNGCTAKDSVSITRIQPLPATFLPKDAQICAYESLTLKANTSFNRYSWSTGATSPQLTITGAGLYWLEVTDAYDCKGRDSIQVAIKQDCITGFHMPTAFTPNKDGKNDLFKPLIFGQVKQYRFTVYNRWGELVFTSKEAGKGWDGKLKGHEQDSNVFIWSCVYQLEGGEVKSEKGSVTLLR